ncbi:MAG: transposase, partial [Geminicoccaceae bacterium]
GAGWRLRRHDGRRRDRHGRVPRLHHTGAHPRALKRSRPDAIVVMDNLAAHKAAIVRKTLEAAGIGYRYLPAYSPDLNPIELAWSKLKAYLRARAARSREALDRTIPDALATITPSNAQGWFRHAGYPLH